MGNAKKGFSLPKDGLIYSENIFNRCRDFISYNIWSGMDQWRLDAWINNFQTPEEKYFAACVLDALIYRSESQTISLAKQLFQRVIPDIARIKKLPVQLKQVKKLLAGLSDPRIRVAPVIKATDPLTKSGPTITRMLKRHLRVDESWMVRPEEIEKKLSDADVFIFIDDFLGTGDQFQKFFASTGLNKYSTNTCFIYAPLVAHEVGCAQLKKIYPDINICSVETLTDKNAFFSETGGIFPDDTNSPEAARDFYYNLLRTRKIEVDGPERRGFGHFELVYAFQTAVPDNSLPILWWADSEQWKPLFDR